MEIIDRLIDLVENTEPECFIGINSSSEYEDEEGSPIENACEVTLIWRDRDYQFDITAPLCRIGIPEEGKPYGLDTLVFGGTSADWEYWFNVAGLSYEEEDVLKEMMADKMAKYNPAIDGCVIEHY